jgi:hypothetical protein
MLVKAGTEEMLCGFWGSMATLSPTTQAHRQAHIERFLTTFVW